MQANCSPPTRCKTKVMDRELFLHLTIANIHQIRKQSPQNLLPMMDQGTSQKCPLLSLLQMPCPIKSRHPSHCPPTCSATSPESRASLLGSQTALPKPSCLGASDIRQLPTLMALSAVPSTTSSHVLHNDGIARGAGQQPSRDLSCPDFVKPYATSSCCAMTLTYAKRWIVPAIV